MMRPLLCLAVGAAVAALGGFAPGPARATEMMIVRVAVQVDQPAVMLNADGPVQVVARDTGSAVTLAGTAWTVLPSASGLTIAGTAFGEVVRVSAGTGLLRIAGKPYRGTIELQRSPAGRVTAIDELPLEAYLYGVIKGEIDPAWPPAAVQAQAVAARTLAVERIAEVHAGVTGYDLTATTDAQVYLGAAAENPAATAAVDATRGLLVTYQGQPIFAAYHSNSGGHTEDSENVWGTAYPYLRGVADPYALSAPSVEWMVTLPLASIEATLQRAQVAVAGLGDVSPGRETAWGRAITVRLTSGDGSVQEINANRFRLLVGAGVIRSTMFTVTRDGASEAFSGRGSGHGVGLDQWGARAMAAQGATFEQILKFYYTGVDINQLY